MSQRQHGASLDRFRGQVRLADLNRDWFEDAELAEDLAGDCLRLFEVSEAEFAKVRGQRWYKRVWSTLTGGNTRVVAKGCESLAQAQQLLLRVLQTHAQSNARSNALMVAVAQGLRHLEYQQNQVVASILHMADRLELVEKEVELHRRQLQGDPANESTWNQEHRLLLFKTMVLAAHADGHIAPQERELLEHEQGYLGLSGEYEEEARDFLASPSSIDSDLVRIDSYQTRLAIFRHALGVMYSDGHIDPLERVAIERLSNVLHIREVDEARVKMAFSDIDGVPSQAQLLGLMSARKKRACVAPGPAEYQELEEERRRVQQVAAKRETALEEVALELGDVGPAWARFAATTIAIGLQHPVTKRFEAYGALEGNELGGLLEAMDPEGVLAEVNEWLPQVCETAAAFVGDLESELAFSADVHHAFENAWKRAIDDDAGWEVALAELAAAGEDLRESIPSGLGQAAIGGALGYAGAALLGPLGWAAGATVAILNAGSDTKALERAATRWDAALSRLSDSTERWGENVGRIFEEFYLMVVDQISGSLADASNAESARYALRQMWQDMSDEVEPEEERSASGATDCPRCGRGYSVADRYCDICEVAL